MWLLLLLMFVRSFCSSFIKWWILVSRIIAELCGGHCIIDWECGRLSSGFRRMPRIATAAVDNNKHGSAGRVYSVIIRNPGLLGTMCPYRYPLLAIQFTRYKTQHFLIALAHWQCGCNKYVLYYDETRCLFVWPSRLL